MFIIGSSIILYPGFKYIIINQVVNKSYVQVNNNEVHISNWLLFVC
jgi:hypothetical protein